MNKKAQNKQKARHSKNPDYEKEGFQSKYAKKKVARKIAEGTGKKK